MFFGLSLAPRVLAGGDTMLYHVNLLLLCADEWDSLTAKFDSDMGLLY